MGRQRFSPEQERFAEVWDKVKTGTATPEEREWLEEVQNEYWARNERQRRSEGDGEESL